MPKSDNGVAKTRLWPAAASAFIAGEPIERGAGFADALYIVQHFQWSPFDLSGGIPAFWTDVKTGFTSGIPNPVFKYELASVSLFGDGKQTALLHMLHRQRIMSAPGLPGRITVVQVQVWVPIHLACPFHKCD